MSEECHSPCRRTGAVEHLRDEAGDERNPIWEEGVGVIERGRHSFLRSILFSYFLRVTNEKIFFKKGAGHLF